MRPGQQNRRMRNRSNNGNGNNNQSGNNGQNNQRRGPNPLTRSYESNGPDVKVRGTAQNIAEKYLTLARDAQSSGDRVMAESYLQHAEHYNRIIAAALAQQNQFAREEENQPYDTSYGDGRFDDVHSPHSNQTSENDTASENDANDTIKDEQPNIGQPTIDQPHQPRDRLPRFGHQQRRRHSTQRSEAEASEPSAPVQESMDVHQAASKNETHAFVEAILDNETASSDEAKSPARRERVPRPPRAPRAPRTPRIATNVNLPEGTGLLATLARGADKPTQVTDEE